MKDRGGFRGFTLIELIAVLTILAVAAGAATVMLGGPQRSVQLQDVLDRLAHDDALCRQQARRLGAPVEWVIDLERQQLQRRVLGEQRTDAQDMMLPWALPTGYAIEQLHVQGQGAVHRQTAVRYSPQGRSLSFAVQVSAPVGRNGQRRSRWLLIAGASGQAIELANADEVQAVFEVLDEDASRSRHATAAR